MNKNDIVSGRIIDITNEGYGVLKVDTFPIFVPYTAINEVVEVKIIKLAKTYGVGRVMKIIEDVKEHIEPKCEYYKVCGGCSLQHLTYEAELAIKQNYAIETMKRIGKMNETKVEISPILGSKEIYHYRNKAEYPISLNEDGTCSIGFYKAKSHSVTDLTSCLLQPEVFDQIVELTREFINRNHTPIYSEETHKGILRHLYIREASVTKELMVCLVATKDVPNVEELIDTLAKKVPTLTSFVLNINTSNSNVILGNEVKILYGSSTIKDVLCGNTIEISPLSFYQVNHDQAEVLYGRAKDFARLTGKETLIDLYCGAGTIGLSMADSIAELYGVEIIEPAIENAKVNAKLNGIENAHFEAGDASILAAKLADKKIKPDVIVVDPPRKGISEDVIEAMKKMNPKRIVYVSCNVATLARDSEIIERTSLYKLKKLQMVDLFPRTNHVECVALFEFPDINTHRYIPQADLDMLKNDRYEEYMNSEDED